MRLVIATSNEDKVREIDEILEGTGYKAVSMKEAGFCLRRVSEKIFRIIASSFLTAGLMKESCKDKFPM